MSENKTLSRSEVVRQRRRAQTQQQQRPQKKKSWAKKKSSYRVLPPITTRGVVNDFAIERRKKSGKRHFNAVFSLARPKARKLSMPQMQIRVGWRLLSFSLLLVFGTGLYFLWTSAQFRVNGALVTGNQRISADEINSVLGLIEYPVFLLSPAHIKDQTLRNYPELASVEVTVSLPNIVTVNVTERQPLILWQEENGYTWIDDSGIAFRPRGEVQGLIVVQSLVATPSVPASEGDPLTSVPLLPEAIVKAIIALAPHVPPDTLILYDPVTGISWADERGWQAVFGNSGDNVEVKIRVYHALVNWLSQQNIRPGLINVAYPRAPYYRMEKVIVQAEEQ